MKVIAFGASYSKHSINRKFAAYAASLISEDFEVLDLNKYQLPLFTVDLEAEIGHPDTISEFLADIDRADLLVISMGEHNGSYQAAFKNLMDWTSRVKAKFFENKKILLLSTSTGGRGGKGVLEAALDRFPRHGATIIDHFSLPNFNDNFQEPVGIVEESLTLQFKELIRNLNH